MTGQKRIVIAAAAILWLWAVVAVYYTTHKPFGPELALRLLGTAWRIAVPLAICSLAGGLGARWLPLAGENPATRAAVQAAFGMGVWGLLILVLGAAVGVNSWIAGGLLVAGGVFFRQRVPAWWRLWGRVLAARHDSGRLGRGLAFGTALILLFNLATALAPPLKFDALVYHLSLPQAYLTAGRILYLPWNVFWGMPQLTEMLYLWGMALAGGQAAPVLGWMIGVLALAGLWGYLEQRFGARLAWVGLAALLSGFTLASSLSWGYVGWSTILMAVSALVVFERWRLEGGARFLVLAGVFTGLALGVKYTAGVLLPGGLGVVWWHHRTTGHKRAALWRGWVLYAGVALFVFAPWGLKNLLATGNPGYPLLFPAGAMGALRLDLYQNQPPQGDWRDAVLLPWRATILGVEGAEGYSASIGPLLLGLGALAWLRWGSRDESRRTTLANAAIFALAGLAVWAISGRVVGLSLQTRLYLSLFPAFAVLAAAGFGSLERIRLPGVRPGRLASVSVLLVFGLTTLQIAAHTFRQNPFAWLLALQSEETYLANNLGMYALAIQAIETLPDDARVLMLWEPRSYYCAPRCFPDEVLDRWLADRARYRAADAILRSWQAAGFTHLLFYRGGADFYQNDPRYQPADWETLDALLSGLPALTDLDNVYTLYQLP